MQVYAHTLTFSMSAYPVDKKEQKKLQDSLWQKAQSGDRDAFKEFMDLPFVDELTKKMLWMYVFEKTCEFLTWFDTDDCVETLSDDDVSTQAIDDVCE